MKKIFVLAAMIMLSMCICCSCGDKSSETGHEDSLSVVTTIFPEYDWVSEISEGVDSIEITMLLDKGVDLHSYQPTSDDVVKISECDVFIYVGGESDEWVEDALAEAQNKDMKVIKLIDVLGDNLREEEIVEGMQAEEESEEGEEAGEGPEYDEHVWLSLNNAQILCSEIADVLSDADSENGENYQKNAAAYIEKLTALDKEYAKAVKTGTKDTLVFADRFPFRYLTDDYGLNYYAAFIGCSAESEASFETIKFLAGKVDELGVHNVVKIEGSDDIIARTVIDNTKTKDQEIVELDSMQSVTAEDVENGASYIKSMENNLEQLKKVLE